MKKLFVNPGPNTMYVLGTAIPPGEQYTVEVADEPTEAAPAAAPTLADLVMAELAKPVKELLPLLPNMSDDALELMTAVEQQAKAPRTTLLAALSDVVLRRGAEALERQQQKEADARINEANDAAAAAADGAPAA